MKILKNPCTFKIPRSRAHSNGDASIQKEMAAPPAQFIAFQAFNKLKKTIRDMGNNFNFVGLWGIFGKKGLTTPNLCWVALQSYGSAPGGTYINLCCFFLISKPSDFVLNFDHKKSNCWLVQHSVLNLDPPFNRLFSSFQH